MRFILYIICVAYGLMAHAQNETTGFTSYETRQGLSNNAVLCLLQDSRNFLWIGTKEGLNRFDGHRFKKFFRQRNVSNGLASNYIFDILEYQYGQLLITTNNGISVLNTLTGQFENEKIKFAPLKPGSGTSVLSAFKATNGQIWISHNGEMDILDSTLKYLYRFTDIPWAKTLKGSLIFKDGYYDDQHRLWFPTDSSGIQIIDFAAKQVWNYKNNPLKLPFLNATKRYIRAFWVDEKNKALWYAPWGEGLSKYDFNTQLEQHQLFGLKGLLEFCTVDAIIQKNARRLICCVGDMICEVDINSLAYTKIIDKKIALVFIKTRDAQFWAGTPRGLLRLQDSPPYIRKLAFDGQEKVPALGECTSVAATKSGRLYVTYFNNALLQVEKDRETARFYKVNDNASIKLSSVCEDKSGRIWIGTSRGIFFFDSHSGKFLKPAWLPKALQASTINLVFCDRTGEVWIGTRNPFILFRYDPAQNQLQQITNNIVDRFTALYADSRISRIYEDKQNNLWMTSYLGGGIIQYNKASGEWKMWPQTTRHSNQLVNKGIIMLYPDDHNLWSIDYLGDGLNCYNYLTDSLTRFRREDGLASEYIKNFAADGNGNLWISNEFGLTKFNLKSHQTISYNLQNTLAANYENGENFFDTVTNSIVYPLSDHLLFVGVGQFKKNDATVIPYIDKFTVDNKEVFINAARQQPSFKHDENNISIEFSAVNFSNESDLDFAYQLSGLDTVWRTSDANRAAHFANLAPGDYIFKIKIANETGEWGRPDEVLLFTIKPVFWQTIWFPLSIFGLVILIIFLFVSKRIKTIRWEAGLKHKLAETEMIALRSQMNPHFIFNCLNAIDNLIQTNQANKATTYLARFAKLIRSVLESSKSNVVPFHKDFDTLKLFLELEQFRCNNKFEYEIYAERELLEGDYKVPPLIVQPFVENAIHHGLLNKERGERKVIVKASLENNFIRYIVQDNGVGRAKALEIKNNNKPEHQSYGIQITTERIHLHNRNGKPGDIVITDMMDEDKPGGTIVEIKLAAH